VCAKTHKHEGRNAFSTDDFNVKRDGALLGRIPTINLPLKLRNSCFTTTSTRIKLTSGVRTFKFLEEMELMFTPDEWTSIYIFLRKETNHSSTSSLDTTTQWMDFLSTFWHVNHYSLAPSSHLVNTWSINACLFLISVLFDLRNYLSYFAIFFFKKKKRSTFIGPLSVRVSSTSAVKPAKWF
jgi:hypothetical protein